MNELESILNYLETTSLEPHDDYTSEFTYKEQKLLWNYIKKLKEQLEKEKEVKSKAIGHVNACGGELTKDECKYLLQILDTDKGE